MSWERWVGRIWMYGLKCGAWLIWRCKIVSSQYLRTIRRRRSRTRKWEESTEGRCPWNLHFGVWDWKVECRTLHPEVKNRKNSHRWTCLASSLLPRVQPDKEAHGLGWGCAAVSENTSFHSGWEAAPSGCWRMEGKGLKTARTLSSQRLDRKRSRGRCGNVEMVNFHHGTLQNACNYRGKRLRSWGDGSAGEVLSKVPILRTYTVEYLLHL